MKNRPFNKAMAFRTYLVRTLLPVCWILAAAGSVDADRSATEQSADPIRITADKLVTNSRTNSAQFTGTVKAVQGESILMADRLTLFFESNKGDDTTAPGTADASTGIKRIEARGHVRIEFDNRVAVGEQAVYITDERKLVLEGPGAKVVSGKDEVVGSKITFFRDDGRVSMEGDGKNRVKAIIHSDQRGLN